MRIFKAFALALMLCGAAALPAQAAQLFFNPLEQAVQIGLPFNIDVVAKLDTNENLASFFVDVAYDDAFLAFNSLELGNGLGTLGVDAVDASLPPEPGLINLSVESFLSDFSSQAETLVLGSLSFTPLALGQTTLEFGLFSSLEDTDFRLLDVTTRDGKVSPVPLPGAVWLLSGALVGLLGLRRKLS